MSTPMSSSPAANPVVTVVGDVATVRVDRPDAGNALDLPTALGLREAVRGIAARPPHVVVVTAAGRMFCAGGDVRAMAAAADRAAFIAELAGVLHEALVALRELPVPVVAAVQGTAAGAGIGLLPAADIVVASDRARFVNAYTGVGLSPDCGVTALLAKAIGARRAALFTLTGRVLDAPTAVDWGLVSEVCPHELLDARVAEIVATVTAQPRESVGQSARLLRRAADVAYATQLDDEAATIARLSATADAARLIHAFAAPKTAN